MHIGIQAGSLYQTNHIMCRLLVVYFIQIYIDSLRSSILVKSVRQARFGHLCWPSLLDIIKYKRRPKSILVKSGRQTLFSSLFQLILYPCFDREFQSSLYIENTSTSLYISQVYSLSRQRETSFACLFFEPVSSLCKSISVKSVTGNRQADRHRHSNACPGIYQSSVLSLERDKYLL